MKNRQKNISINKEARLSKKQEREENEELPESSVAVEINTQRHEKKRGGGKEGLAQSQREAGAGPQ